MASRLQLQTALEVLLGSTNVYYEPPASFLMEYDCIRYRRDRIDTKRADDKNYLKTNRYELTYIHRNPVEQLTEDLLDEFEMITMDRSYSIDGLTHDVYTLYY